MGIWGTWLGFWLYALFIISVFHASNQNIFPILALLLSLSFIHKTKNFCSSHVWIYKTAFAKITPIYLHLFVCHLWRCLCSFKLRYKDALTISCVLKKLQNGFQTFSQVGNLKTKYVEPCMVAHTFNPGTWEAEADGALWAGGLPGLHSKF